LKLYAYYKMTDGQA